IDGYFSDAVVGALVLDVLKVVKFVPGFCHDSEAIKRRALHQRHAGVLSGGDAFLEDGHVEG
ncbi:MAG: hypothetical protein ACRD3J_05545, partial [Thermoanaerobaculia bacterium]